MTSRNLLDPNARDPLMKRLTPDGREITTATTPRLWCVASLVGEIGLGKSKLSEVMRTVPADYVDGRTRYWYLSRVLEQLSALELRRVTGIAEGEELDPVQELARKNRALARESELRVEEREGSLLPLEDVRAQDAAHIAAVAAALDVLGATVKYEIAAIDDPEAVERVIDEAVRQLRTRIVEALDRATGGLAAEGDSLDLGMDSAPPDTPAH